MGGRAASCCALIAVALLGGCGGGAQKGGRPDAPRPVASNPLDAALLTARELAARSTSQPQGRSTFRCSGSNVLARLGAQRKSSQIFHLSDADVQQTVALFATTRAAAHAVATLNAPRNWRCLGADLKRSASTLARLQRLNLNVEGFKARMWGQRLIISVPDGQGVYIHQYADVVIAREGRLVSTVGIGSRDGSISQQSDERVAAALSRHIVAAGRQTTS